MKRPVCFKCGTPRLFIRISPKSKKMPTLPTLPTLPLPTLPMPGQLRMQEEPLSPHQRRGPHSMAWPLGTRQNNQKLVLLYGAVLLHGIARHQRRLRRPVGNVQVKSYNKKGPRPQFLKSFLRFITRANRFGFIMCTGNSDIQADAAVYSSGFARLRFVFLQEDLYFTRENVSSRLLHSCLESTESDSQCRQSKTWHILRRCQGILTCLEKELLSKSAMKAAGWLPGPVRRWAHDDACNGMYMRKQEDLRCLSCLRNVRPFGEDKHTQAVRTPSVSSYLVHQAYVHRQLLVLVPVRPWWLAATGQDMKEDTTRRCHSILKAVLLDAACLCGSTWKDTSRDWRVA